ncbi:FtsK/SpoIIIE domain-containing protein [Glutamicibacter sp. TV12E]|uniref:FtsK/SpoIIIE domain-containing protein n=1 Tax=Glutamicibacter sp. TV12E TaxID=3446362 RepID=UPI004034A570
MPRYEFLLISQLFQHPRQFELVSTGRLTGDKLSSILLSSFPNQYWYFGQDSLESLGSLASGQKLILSDIPQVQPEYIDKSATLKLYVLHGPDSGAWISLTQGEHSIGRGAPLWLEDPLISRCHATLNVSTRRLRLVAAANHQITREDGILCSSMDLVLGSRFRLGNTFFVVGDPVATESKKTIRDEDLEVHVPPKPEMSRLVMLSLAALVPILTGVLLAILMGTMFFLIISGISALMGLAPASQLVSELRRWKRAMRAQRNAVIQNRSTYAAPLGQAIIAGLDATALNINSPSVPPLVWGDGLWSPQLHESPQSDASQRSRFKLKRRKLDAPWHGPVFSPSVPGVWHLVGAQGPETGGVLASVLARFLPLIATGKLSLYIDPSIRCLPASLLLMKNVTASSPPMPSEQSPWQREVPLLKSIYLTAAPTRLLPETLIIGLGPRLPEAAEHWIEINSHSTHLPDQRFVLKNLHRLSLMRFDRTVQQLLRLLPSGPIAVQQALSEPANIVRAAIGVTDEGTEVALDLDSDGPHMLICGTTGSGKSEALRRIVADLAHSFSPQHLAFVLIDFKGGAGLSVFKPLPHVQLFASDLDESSAQRTLEQLEFEIRRREKLLADSGCSDLGEYQMLTPVPQPLPRLVVVVDEFRVFVESLPTAGQRIDRLAAVGRALGIHLILSTQRPAGALTGQTRANINAVIALRVNDPSESVELIGSTAATLLDQPGQAIMRSSSRPTGKVQFHLAVEPDLKGEIFERNRNNMAVAPFCTFEPEHELSGPDPLTVLLEQLTARWVLVPKPVSGFAPPLPLTSEEALIPTGWPGKDKGTIFCGVRDNLSGGTLEPLVVNTAQGHSLLICGLPEAGARKSLNYLVSLRRKILCFGPEPVTDAHKHANLKVITGNDTYAFLDALDYLESLPRDDGLIIMVHSLAQLQSVLHPQHFQRFDEALGSLLRSGSQQSPFIVCAVDRDQNCLKSTGLFTTQWYFPYNSTESLKMIWPKIPACSPITGRGVIVTADNPPQVFQLAPAQAVPREDDNWNYASPEDSAYSQAPHEASQLLGYCPFTGRPIARPQQARLIMICPDADERLKLSLLLADRWNASHANGIEELASRIDDFESGKQDSPAMLCVYLESTAQPRLMPAIEKLGAINVPVVFFTPPSARLAYELGLSALGLDDREFAVVESEHSQDMQPMQWPALHHEPSAENRPYWRAIISRNGQPRMIHIPRDIRRK